jgi:serine protease Do
MDNDFKEETPEINGTTDNKQPDDAPRTEYTHPGGYYQQPYYSQPWPPQNTGGWEPYYSAPQPTTHAVKKKSGWRALIAVLMVICLFAGVAAGTFFLAPLIAQWQSVAMGEQGNQPNSEEGLLPIPETTQVKPEASSPVHEYTGETPEIGGFAPDIDPSANPIVQIAKEVGPAVVGVTISVNQQLMGQEDATEMESGYGTGIIVREDGYIVTNNHVIQGSDSVKVTLVDGTDYPATVIGTDRTTDLAVLKIAATGLTAAALGDSDALEVGETVVAIGNPLGSDLAGSVTSGIVSALGREISTNGYSQKYIQTDAAINPGNSGGALVNIKGEVIGINTLKSYLAGYDDYGVPIGTEGIGFAIPISTARPIIEQLMTTGSVVRPGIGISCLVDETNMYNPADAPVGVTVVEVVKGGPADKAGLQPGDIIITIEGTPTETVEALMSVIRSHAIGDDIELKVWRSGQEYRATVTVGDLNKMS